jgi:lipopolysaccharide biosynthesis glycosyltransferase
MPEESPIHVFLSSDENYVPHLAVAVASIVDNAAQEDRVSFHILACGFSADTRRELSRIAARRDFPVRFVETRP